MKSEVVVGTVLDDNASVSLEQVCRVCRVETQWVVELVEYGVLDPITGPEGWSFRGSEMRRVRRAVRLQRDLGVNVAGIALVLDMMDELERLRARVGRRF